jgi:hypothetical protein
MLRFSCLLNIKKHGHQYNSWLGSRWLQHAGSVSDTEHAPHAGCFTAAVF